MERRRAIAIAAATAATTLAAVSAVAANFGLLGFGQASAGPIGSLGATQPAVSEPAADMPPGVTVRYEDIYLPAPPATAAGATAAVASPDGGTPSTAADGSWDDSDGSSSPAAEDEDGDHDEDRDDEDDDRNEHDGHEDDD
jgi:hypothetical protein